jgi:hypothetical protein
MMSKLGPVRGWDVGFGFGVYHTMSLLLMMTTGRWKGNWKGAYRKEEMSKVDWYFS